MSLGRLRFIDVDEVAARHTVVEVFGYQPLHQRSPDANIHLQVHRPECSKGLHLGRAEAPIEHVASK